MTVSTLHLSDRVVSVGNSFPVRIRAVMESPGYFKVLHLYLMKNTA